MAPPATFTDSREEQLRHFWPVLEKIEELPNQGSAEVNKLRATFYETINRAWVLCFGWGPQSYKAEPRTPYYLCDYNHVPEYPELSGEDGVARQTFIKKLHNQIRGWYSREREERKKPAAAARLDRLMLQRVHASLVPPPERPQALTVYQRKYKDALALAFEPGWKKVCEAEKDDKAREALKDRRAGQLRKFAAERWRLESKSVKEEIEAQCTEEHATAWNEYSKHFGSPDAVLPNSRGWATREAGVFMQAFADWAAWRYGVVVNIMLAGRMDEAGRTEALSVSAAGRKHENAPSPVDYLDGILAPLRTSMRQYARDHTTGEVGRPPQNPPAHVVDSGGAQGLQDGLEKEWEDGLASGSLHEMKCAETEGPNDGAGAFMPAIPGWDLGVQEGLDWSALASGSGLTPLADDARQTVSAHHGVNLELPGAQMPGVMDADYRRFVGDDEDNYGRANHLGMMNSQDMDEDAPPNLDFVPPNSVTPSPAKSILRSPSQWLTPSRAAQRRGLSPDSAIRRATSVYARPVQRRGGEGVGHSDTGEDDGGLSLNVWDSPEERSTMPWDNLQLPTPSALLGATNLREVSRESSVVTTASAYRREVQGQDGRGVRAIELGADSWPEEDVDEGGELQLEDLQRGMLSGRQKGEADGLWANRKRSVSRGSSRSAPSDDEGGERVKASKRKGAGGARQDKGKGQARGDGGVPGLRLERLVGAMGTPRTSFTDAVLRKAKTALRPQPPPHSAAKDGPLDDDGCPHGGGSMRVSSSGEGQRAEQGPGAVAEGVRGDTTVFSPEHGHELMSTQEVRDFRGWKRDHLTPPEGLSAAMNDYCVARRGRLVELIDDLDVETSLAYANLVDAGEAVLERQSSWMDSSRHLPGEARPATFDTLISKRGGWPSGILVPADWVQQVAAYWKALQPERRDVSGEAVEVWETPSIDMDWSTLCKARGWKGAAMLVLAMALWINRDSRVDPRSQVRKWTRPDEGELKRWRALADDMTQVFKITALKGGEGDGGVVFTAKGKKRTGGEVEKAKAEPKKKRKMEKPGEAVQKGQHGKGAGATESPADTSEGRSAVVTGSGRTVKLPWKKQ